MPKSGSARQTGGEVSKGQSYDDESDIQMIERHAEKLKPVPKSGSVRHPNAKGDLT